MNSTRDLNQRTIPKADMMFGIRDYMKSIGFILAMVIGAVVLYHGPKIAGQIMQLIVLFLFARSKHTYLWLAVYMFTSFVPGGLYQIGIPRNLVILSTAFIGDLTFTFAFATVAIVKVILAKHKKPFYTSSWFVIFIFLLAIIPTYGAKPTYVIKGFANFSLLISIPLLIKNHNELDDLFRLIFAGSVFVAFTNVFQVVTGYPFVRAIAGSVFANVDSTYYLFRVEDTSGMIRAIWGAEYAFLSIMGSLYYITKRVSPFNVYYLYSMLMLGWINIMFSATRGWILAVTFMIVVYTFIMIPKLFRSIVTILPVMTILFLGVWQIPVVKTQIKKAFMRLETSESILSGELTVEATGGRNTRYEIVMSKFRESPIIGMGYGETAMEYDDTHTGNQTMLMQFGIVGYLLFVFLWLGFIFTLISHSRRGINRSAYKNALIVPVLGLISLFIIHSTSGMLLHPFTGGVFVAFVFALGNFILSRIKAEERSAEPVL